LQPTKLYNEFINSEKTGGRILFFVTVISLVLANSSIGTDYNQIWHYEIAGHSLLHLINDGLMTFFPCLSALSLKGKFISGTGLN
jgi:NhaA family Na+:H+ antiporter